MQINIIEYYKLFALCLFNFYTKIAEKFQNNKL